MPASLFGAILGAWLLLHLSEKVFITVVPVLLVNVVAALAYTSAAFHRISWPASGLIAVGSLIGGWLGAHYGRRLSSNALRAAIVLVGLIGVYRLLTI